jgi:hypothetical protein
MWSCNSRWRGPNQVWTTLKGKKHNVVVKKAVAMASLKTSVLKIADDLNQFFAEDIETIS